MVLTIWNEKYLAMVNGKEYSRKTAAAQTSPQPEDLNFRESTKTGLRSPKQVPADYPSTGTGVTFKLWLLLKKI